MESRQDSGIRTGLRGLRNLLNYCMNVDSAPNVHKALGNTEMRLTCPFPPGVSSGSINNKKVEGKCHKRCAGEVPGEH